MGRLCLRSRLSEGTGWSIYDYAVTVMNPEKIFFGLPAYGWNWQIYDLPANLGKTYRGTSNTYYAAKNWMTGQYNLQTMLLHSPSSDPRILG